MEYFEVFFQDEVRQIKCGLRRVWVKLTETEAIIYYRKHAPKVHMSRQRFFALAPRKLFRESGRGL